jgi:hypothetical protein
LSDIDAYPLCWPPSFPRTMTRRRAVFKPIGFDTARRQLFRELHLMKATDLILSTNIPLRQDGMPYAGAAEKRITDPGVAIYFKWRGAQRALACDKWERIEHNLHALELTIAAMRGLERWGASAVLERAFTGFTALPAPAQWWDVLGVQPDDDLAVMEAAYRRKMKEAHPDLGGTEGQASTLNWAIEKAREAWDAA